MDMEKVVMEQIKFEEGILNYVKLLEEKIKIQTEIIEMQEETISNLQTAVKLRTEQVEEYKERWKSAISLLERRSA